MTISTRRPSDKDTAQMAGLLNEIIAIGGTTAHTTPIGAEDLRAGMAREAGRNYWTVACAEDGRIMGYQYINPHPDLPQDSASIATFVRVGATGQGIGSRLFRDTCAGARQLGFRRLVAVIRADNTGGLAYYSSRGFQDYDVLKDMALDNGLVVDRICKRFELSSE